MKSRSLLSAIALIVLLAAAAQGEIVETSATGMKIIQKCTVSASPEKAWQSFVQIGRWWSGEHTYSGDAANLHLEVRPGGCWCETLPNGGGVLHMTVVYVVPNQRMTLAGGLGPLQIAGVAGAMTFQVVAKDSGSEIALLYNVGGYYPGGLNSVAGGVDAVLGEQLARLARLIDTGDANEKKPSH